MGIAKKTISALVLSIAVNSCAIKNDADIETAQLMPIHTCESSVIGLEPIMDEICQGQDYLVASYPSYEEGMSGGKTIRVPKVLRIYNCKNDNGIDAYVTQIGAVTDSRIVLGASEHRSVSIMATGVSEQTEEHMRVFVRQRMVSATMLLDINLYAQMGKKYQEACQKFPMNQKNEGK